jgi:beta-glucanase (GH16 family)
MLCCIHLMSCSRQIDKRPVAEKPGGWKLVWSDEFDYSGLPDPEKWSYDVGTGEDGWGNQELQYYTEKRLKNARVEGGKLIIEAHQEKMESGEYTSARLVTKGKASWTYGRFEIRAKLPDGVGTWPAIWTLPVDWNLGRGIWPDVGELDIMEHVGYETGIIHATAHSKAYHYQWQSEAQRTASVTVENVESEFHTYGMEWEADEVRWYVDGEEFYKYTNEGSGWEAWPYNRDFYLLLNLAVGGAWGGVKGIDGDAFPQRMEIEFVRVYQR